ncbi:hypothetical protein D3C77_287760 [compost metagenome]
MLIVTTVPTLLNRLPEGVTCLLQSACQRQGIGAFDGQVHPAAKRRLQWPHTPGRFGVPVLLEHDLAVAEGQKGKLVLRAVVLNLEAQYAAVKA